MKHCFSFPLPIFIICITHRLTAAALTRQHDNDGQQRPNNNMRGSRVLQSQGCFQYCTFQWNPVCGSDGKTYGNACELNRAKCDNQNLKQVRKGDCNSRTNGCSQTAKCTAQYDPVCGSDGKTYGNACKLNRAKCDNQNLKQVRKDDCNSRTNGCSKTAQCTAQYDPVCGSDGRTYINACELNRAGCNNQNLKQVRKGVCNAADEWSCTDNTGKFKDKRRELTCKHVDSNSRRRKVWCKRSKPKKICPVTCNTCESADRSAVRCTDDRGATFRIKNKSIEITCADLAGYAKRKTEYWCGRSNVAPISCRATCNTC